MPEPGRAMHERGAGASTRVETLRATSRVIFDLPKLLPAARISPAALLARRAAKTPGALAIAYRDERHSWAGVERESMRYAAWLAGMGVGRGDAVAILMDNRPDFLFALMGLSRLGAIGALINTNLRGETLLHALRVSESAKVLIGSEHADALREILPELSHLSIDKDVAAHVERDGGADPQDLPLVNVALAATDPAAAPPLVQTRNADTSAYIYTSGTTGLPKAAIIRNQRIVAAGVAFGHMMHRASPGDLIYVSLPLYHSSALFLGWGAALATGAAIGLRRRFSVSEFFDDVRRFEATSFLYIGELCRYLLQSPPRPGERDHRLRVAVGNGLRPELWQDFQDRFGIPVIREFYGATEGNVPIMNTEGRPGMIGRKTRGQIVVRCDAETGEPTRDERALCQLAEPGETGLLLGRINRLLTFDGYLDREASKKKVLENVLAAGDRYFDTGDLVALHAGGWLSFADRVGDTFRWKGENVSTSEVERVLSRVEGVGEANVYGVPLPGSEGRAGMAALRADGGFELERFAEAVMETLPKYQRPLFLRLLEREMRTTATFKHQKVAYRREGYDPGVVSDPLFVFEDGCYRPLDRSGFEAIQRGERVPG